MRCPTIDELPPPPAGKHGWPWTAEGASVYKPSTAIDWPKVSVVTPSYNQASYLEETIRSVLLQSYPNLEYIIMDGGSQDASVDIIRKYEPWISHWVSEKDRGQSDAIDKGFALSTGEVYGWLNSDDLYYPSTVLESILTFQKHVDAVLSYGNCEKIDERGNFIRQWTSHQGTINELIFEANFIPQPSTFFKASAYHKAGGLNKELNFIMDHELWIRLAFSGSIQYSPKVVVKFREHPVSKSLSATPKFWIEWIEFLDRKNEFEKYLTSNEKEELIRRFHLKAALEYLFIRDLDNASHHFLSGLKSNGWPFGGVRNLGLFFVQYSGLSGCSLYSSHEVFQQCVDILKKIRPRKNIKPLVHFLLGNFYMREFFLANESHDNQRVKRNFWRGILYDPSWLANKGVWSIVRKAYLS